MSLRCSATIAAVERVSAAEKSHSAVTASRDRIADQDLDTTIIRVIRNSSQAVAEIDAGSRDGVKEGWVMRIGHGGAFIAPDTPPDEHPALALEEDMDRVILFKKNLEKICQDREELIEQIQITVRHEIGHYLGLDENDLERLGLS